MFRHSCIPSHWSENGRPRVLVESSEAWVWATQLDEAGWDVAMCYGPASDERCPLLASGACGAAEQADAILTELPTRFREALTQRYAGKPIVTSIDELPSLEK